MGIRNGSPGPWVFLENVNTVVSTRELGAANVGIRVGKNSQIVARECMRKHVFIAVNQELKIFCWGFQPGDGDPQST